MSPETSQIQNFFKDQTIFITGGTGLLGQLLIEKLLRSCGNLKKLYVLVRPKRGKTPQQRFQELFQDDCFQQIKSQNLSEKVFLVVGDCEKPFLGLNDQDLDILVKETTCIFHAAANVKFDQTLKEASFHLKCTKDLVEIAKQMRSLKIFIFISSIFTNTREKTIKEEFSEPPMKAETFLEFEKAIDSERLEKITPTLLGDFPNTYLYTKNISEDFIKNSGLQVPVAIIRPANITNTIEEPVKGWIHNDFGLIGFIAGVYSGIIRTFHYNTRGSLNLVPADYLSNFTLAVAWKTGSGTSDAIKIYHCAGKPLNHGKTFELSMKYYWEYSSTKTLWYRASMRETSYFEHKFWMWWFIFVGYCLDFALQKHKFGPRLKQLNQKLDLLSFFATNTFKFEEDNFIGVWNSMSEQDQKLFKFYSKSYNWEEYIKDCLLGIRLYIFKDPIETLPEGKRHAKKLFAIHWATVGCFWFIVLLLVYCVFM